MALIEVRAAGLYCPHGDFYIDPWAPVDRAVITHAHPDRAVPGSGGYLTASPGVALLAESLGEAAAIDSLAYRETRTIGECAISLHPSGHILGSAQVRIEHRGEVWVVSGDYQLASDPTCAAFDPIACHTFVTESAYALPIFRWPEEGATFESIHSWWRANRDAGRASVLFANPLGLAQRLLSALSAACGPIAVHEEVERFSRHYRAGGVPVPEPASGDTGPGALAIAPPSAATTAWMRRYPGASTAMASGWMRIRGPRRRRSLDRGFVLSSHADWRALLAAIDATGAEAVWVTGGQRAPLVHWLIEKGRAAVPVEAHFAEDE